jgi:transcription elongation factor GreA
MPETSYLTKEGAEKLKKELVELKGPAREALAKRLRSAIQQGDLSENADYHAAKEEQGFLEGRIQELERILRDVSFIEDKPRDLTQVDIGSYITVQEEGIGEDIYYLVGPKEADPMNGRISYESPIGKALLGKAVGSEFQIETPNGIIKMKILKIE